MSDLDPRELFGADQPCFGCSPTNPVGMQLAFERDGESAVTTTFTARPGWEGAPGIVHGGLQATLADEIGAWAVIACTGNFGFTMSMQLRYLRPARHALPVHARAELVEHSEKTARVRIKLTQEGKTLLSGTATYLMPSVAEAESILDGDLPDAWRAHTRDHA